MTEKVGRWRREIWGRRADLSLFREGYFEAMLFLDDPRKDEDFEPRDDERSESNIEDISPELWASSVADCDWFLAHPVVNRIAGNPSRMKAGRHLWYTRQGHGVGFWDDGEWPGLAGEILLERAEALPEVSIYLGDDGLIYGL